MSFVADMLVINRALSHTHPHPAKKGHTHPNPHTSSQKMFTLTHRHPHPAKKRSHSPTCSQKKGHTHLHPPTPTKKKDSYPPYSPSPIQKIVTPSLEKVIHPHITEKMSRVQHMIYTWKVLSFHNISRYLHFWKRLTCSSFSIEYFWSGIWIYCLFVCLFVCLFSTIS